MPLGIGNNLIRNGGGLNPDGLALDLQFAADKTLTARKGPTPVLTRGSTGTYFGPLIDVAGEGMYAWTATGITNGRAQWSKSSVGITRLVFYTGTRWKVEITYPEDRYEYFAAAGSEWRPDQANWSGSGTNVTTSSTFGIVRAANNEPRFDHDPVTLASRGLLIEEGRTNLTWPSIYTTANLGVGIFPAGSTTITLNQPSIGTNSNGSALVRETATTQVHGSYVGINNANNPAPAPIVSGTVYTASIFVKADGRTKCRFSFNTGSNIDGIFAAFDISSTGTIITNSTTYGSGASAAGLSASIIKHIDGWFRLSVSGSLTNTGGYMTVETLDDSGNRSYLGDTSKGLFIANAQLEAGSFATSYIPTTTSALARSADVCSITGANFTGMYNQPEGTLFADVTPQTVAQVSLVFGVNTTTFSNSHLIYKTDPTFSGAGRRWGASTNMAVSQEVAIVTPTDIATSRSRLAYAYKLNNYAFAHAGGIVGTDTLANVPSPTTMRIGSRDDGISINGHLAAVRYYKLRLPNAKLQALTA